MARQSQAQADVEETTDSNGPEATADAPKESKKSEPKRGQLPDGYVTPVGFAKILEQRGLQKDRDGNVLTEVRPQMVYSYKKNAPKDDPFPIEKVQDSIGVEREALKIDDGVAWWERKNKRVDDKKANAKAKADKAAENKAKREREAAEKGESSDAGDASVSEAE